MKRRFRNVPEQLGFKTHAADCRCPDCARGPGVRAVLRQLDNAFLPVERVRCGKCGEVIAVVRALQAEPRNCLACGEPLPWETA